MVDPKPPEPTIEEFNAVNSALAWLCGSLAGAGTVTGVQPAPAPLDLEEIVALERATLVAAIAAMGAAPSDVGALEPAPLDLAELDGWEQEALDAVMDYEPSVMLAELAWWEAVALAAVADAGDVAFAGRTMITADLVQVVQAVSDSLRKDHASR